MLFDRLLILCGDGGGGGKSPWCDPDLNKPPTGTCGFLCFVFEIFKVDSSSTVFVLFEWVKQPNNNYIIN